MAKIARWFLDIELDGETLRWCSDSQALVLDGESYTGLGSRWTPPDRIKRKASLKSEKIDLEFDGGRQTDDTDPIGYLLDQVWLNRAVRLRWIAWQPGESPDDGEVLGDVPGRLRNLPSRIRLDDAPYVRMEIESGVLAYLERRRETRTPASQKRVFAGDVGLDLIAKLEGVTLAHNTKHKKVGKRQRNLKDEYEPYPREWQVGRFETAGSFGAAFTNQQQKKSYMQVIPIADHRIKQLDRIWLNGLLNRTTPLVHGQRTLLRVPNDKGEDRVWITFYDGRHDQVADPFLVSVEPSWTTAHRLRGMAYVIFEFRLDSDLPDDWDLRVGGLGAYLYDRRKDSSQGGSGTHRWNDPYSWEYSANAYVATEHYRAGIRVMPGSDAMWLGIGEAVDKVPYSEYAAQADHCDDLVLQKAGGFHRRYEVNGTISAEKDHGRNLQTLANQMAARAINQNGRLSIRSPISRAPVATLEDGDLVRGGESEIDPAGRIDDLVNTLSGQCKSPANDYKKDDYPEVSIDAYIDADGETISGTLDLELENDPERAQRIAYLKIEDSRRILRQNEPYTSAARAVEPGDWFVRKSVMRAFPAGKMFIAEEVTRYADGSVEIEATEAFPSEPVWDETTAKDIGEPGLPPDGDLPDLDAPAFTVTALQTGGSYSALPYLIIGFMLPADLDDLLAEFHDVEIVRDNGAGAPLGTAEIIPVPARQAVQARGPLLASTDYLVRVRARLGKRESAWSAWESVKTTGVFRATDFDGAGNLARRDDIYFGSDYIRESDGGGIATRAYYRTDQGNSLGVIGAGLGLYANNLGDLDSGAAGKLNGIAPNATRNTGALADRNDITLDFVTDRGVLAGRNNVFFGSDLLRESDGGPIATRVNFRTDQGNSLGVIGAGLGLYANNLGDLDSGAAGKLNGIAPNATRNTGALADRNDITLDFVTDRGVLAGRNNVFFGSDLLRESDGGPIATRVNFRTDQGNALGVIGAGLGLYANNLGDLDSGAAGKLNGIAPNATRNVGALADRNDITLDFVTDAGWGAAASEAEVSNAQVPAIGVNRVPFSLMEKDVFGWTRLNNAALMSFNSFDANGKRYIYSAWTATEADQTFEFASSLFRVTPNERLSIQSDFGCSGPVGSSLIYLIYYGADGVTSVDAELVFFNAGAVGEGLRKIFANAPGNAFFAKLDYRVNSNGAGASDMYASRPMVSGASAVQTVHPTFSAGPNAVDGADVTANSPRVSKLNDQGRFSDARGLQANLSFSFPSLSTPPGFSGSGQTTSATIDLDANGKLYGDWGGVISLPSASFPGLATNTRHYIWRNMSAPDGPGESYGISTSNLDALGPNKVYLGYYDTPDGTGAGGGGGGGVPPDDGGGDPNDPGFFYGNR